MMFNGSVKKSHRHSQGPAEEESRNAVCQTERSERKGALTATDAVDMTQGHKYCQ